MDLAGKKVLIVVGQYYTKYGQCDTTYTFTANFLKPQPLAPGGRHCNSEGPSWLALRPAGRLERIHHVSVRSPIYVQIWCYHKID